jgi:hypothetical protein
MNGISYLVLLIQSEAISLRHIKSVIFILRSCIQMIRGYHSEFCYFGLCDFDISEFYVYTFYGVLFGGPHFYCTD